MKSIPGQPDAEPTINILHTLRRKLVSPAYNRTTAAAAAAAAVHI